MRARHLPLAAALAFACGSPRPQTPPATGGDPTPVAPAMPADPAFDVALVAPEVFERALAGKRLDDWYGMYAGEYKVGWMHLQLRPTAAGEPGGWTWRIEGSVTDAGTGEGSTEVRFEEQAFYALAAPHRLVEYRTAHASRDSSTKMRFLAGAAGLSVEETVDDRATGAPRKLPPSRETLASAMVQLSLDPGVVKPGTSAAFWGFDDEQERDERTVVRVERIESRRLAGVPVQVTTASQETEGEAPMQIVVAGGGRVLSAQVGQIVMRLEDETSAKSDVVGFDLLRDAVPYQGDALGEPATVKQLRLRIAGLPAEYPLPDGPNQLVSAAAGGIELALASQPGDPVTAAERRKAMEATQSIDWRDPEITARAGKIIDGADDQRERIARLVLWVYATLAKDLSTNISRASQVLARKVGDCTEHALLFTALARAAGIPARRVAGVTYMGDELRKFGWHEWVEVELDGRWVQVDPSWAEPIANATHIKLEEDDSGRSVALYGLIRLEQVR